MSLGKYWDQALAGIAETDLRGEDEEALEAVANGGSIDQEKWANMVPSVLERLEHIVYNLFPMPKYPAAPAQQFSQDLSELGDANTSGLESSNKENAAPSDSQTGPESSASTERVPDSQLPSDALPPPLALLLSSIRSAIQMFFVEKPPHTIQRFAELILHPKAHYRTLPAYLRAVDRVVAVTSAADVFPFYTPNSTNVESNGLVHPANSAGTYLTPDYAHGGLGSDESLGGALLTPIPWLTNATFDSEGGNAVEPSNSRSCIPSRETAEPSGAATATTVVEGDDVLHTVTSPSAETSDDVPHARGPAIVGVEDLGLQDGRGIEMDLVEQSGMLDGASNARPSEGVTTDAASKDEPTNTPDKDGDIVLDDGKSGEDAKAEVPQASEAAEANVEAPPVEAEQKA
ncbi:Protein phosphatase 4 core regulatory subunit R2 [Penicillium chermesinum]|nr:Protein phosphatase 4 core regulatory subunit R2 [Penicillium chermesinum]